MSENLGMTLAEAAKELRISRGQAYQLAREGRFPVPIIRIGERRLIVSRRAIEELFKNKTED